MSKTIDVGLMANHLSAHQGVISRVKVYMQNANDERLASILQIQMTTLKNHVVVMNELLDPSKNNQSVNLPPVPPIVNFYREAINRVNLGITDKDMLLDAHFTATALANNNFISANNMKDSRVKQLHIEMGLQQSNIAEQYHMLGKQLGWMSHPDAIVDEQLHSMNPLTQQSLNMNNSHIIDQGH